MQGWSRMCIMAVGHWRRTEMAAEEFAAVAERLRAVLAPYRDRLVATKDGPAGVSLEIPGLEGRPAGYVAGIRVGKRYVSYYFMPVYAWPSLLEGMSPELRRRMQGKACFNFARVDEALLAELAAVTARGIERYYSEGWPVAAKR